MVIVSYKAMDFTTLKQHLLCLDTPQLCDADNSIKVIDAKIHPCGSAINLVGIAFTVKTNGNINAVLNAFEHISENDVLMIDSGNSPWAMAGELFALEAKRRNLAGIVIDGYCRDIEGIKAAGLPVFARGVTPKKGVTQNNWRHQIPIICGGAQIMPRDVIFADENGVIAIPQRNLSETLQAAKAILDKEAKIKAQLETGTPLSMLVG